MPLRLALLLWLLGLVVSEASLAGVLTPSDALTTSYWSGVGDGDPIDMIDGGGLSGSGPVQTRTHDNSGNATTMWHAGNVTGALGGPAGNPPFVADQAVVFDLGALFDLGGAFVWNHNQANATERGVAQFEILVSADSDPLTATFTSLGTFALAQAGGSVAEPAQLIPFAASQVRLVKFDILSAHSGLANEYVGLSEVRFAPPLAVPLGSPWTGWVLVAGLLAAGKRGLALRHR